MIPAKHFQLSVTRNFNTNNLSTSLYKTSGFHVDEGLRCGLLAYGKLYLEVGNSKFLRIVGTYQITRCHNPEGNNNKEFLDLKLLNRTGQNLT
jgi:hypothetical protein